MPDQASQAKQPLTIAVCMRAQLRFLMLAICRELKDRHGATLHLYCWGPQQAAFYTAENRDGLFASISDANVLLVRCFETGLDEKQVTARSREVERRLGITLNSLIVPHRHFGRGYSLAGYYHPRSRYSEETSYTQVIHAFCEELAFWESEFRAKRIDLCIDGTREADLICRKLGIPFRILAGARSGNLHYWAHNAQYETPEFEAAWHNDALVEQAAESEPYYAHRASRANSLGRFGFATMVHRVGRTLAKRLYWRIRDYTKARGYRVRDEVMLHWRVWRQYRKITAMAKTKLSDLKDTQFVYFPLHIEPETALHGLSPEYFYQHALIAAVSRDLPAGVRLVVKEAFGAIGRRPDTFYDQIADLKNVVWLDLWEIGLQCARQADAVVTICGSAGLEAVTGGTPVIAFGKHNIYNFLPSVRVVHDEAMLAQYLREALFETDRDTVRADGTRLLAAIRDCAFDLGTYDYIDLKRFEPAIVARAEGALLTSLVRTPGAAVCQPAR
jgi:hypothetical protein